MNSSTSIEGGSIESRVSCSRADGYCEPSLRHCVRGYLGPLWLLFVLGLVVSRDNVVLGQSAVESDGGQERSSSTAFQWNNDHRFSSMPRSWRVSRRHMSTYSLDRMGHYVQLGVGSKGLPVSSHFAFRCAPTAEPTLISILVEGRQDRFFVIPASAPGDLDSSRLFSIDIGEVTEGSSLTLAYATVADSQQVRTAIQSSAVELTSPSGVRVKLGLEPRIDFYGQILGCDFLSMLEGLPTRRDQNRVEIQALPVPFLAGSELTIQSMGFSPGESVPGSETLAEMTGVELSEVAPAIQQRREFRLLDSGVGLLEITIENTSNVALNYEVQFSGGGTKLDRRQTVNRLARDRSTQTNSTEASFDSATSLLQLEVRREAPHASPPDWLLARSGQRVLAYGFEQEERVQAARQPYWAVGWQVFADGVQVDSRSDVAIEAERYQVEVGLTMPPHSTRVVRVAFAIHEQLTDGLQLLDQSLSGETVTDSPASELPVSLEWSLESSEWSYFLADHERRVLDIQREQSQPLELSTMPGVSIRHLTPWQLQLVGRDLIWLDPEKSETWILLNVAQADEQWRFEQELRRLGIQTPAQLNNSSGWAVVAWRHYLIHRDIKALRRFYDALQDRMAIERECLWPEPIEPAGHGFYATADLERWLWAEDLGAMESMAAVLGEDQTGRAYGEALKEYLKAFVESSRSANGGRSILDSPQAQWLLEQPQARMQVWYQQWLLNRPTFARDPGDHRVYPFGIHWSQASESDLSSARWLWSSLAAHELAVAEPDSLEIFAAIETTWIARRSGALTRHVPQLVDAHGFVPNDLRITDQDLVQWNAIDWTLERLAGIRIQDDGQVVFDPVKSNLAWGRATLPNFRGAPLRIEWRIETQATGQGQAATQAATQDLGADVNEVQPLPAPADLALGVRVIWGDKLLLDERDVDPSRRPVVLFPSWEFESSR